MIPQIRYGLAVVLAALTISACKSTEPATRSTPSPATATTPASGAARTAPTTATVPKANVPAPKEGNEAFFKKHESFLARGKAGPIGVLFLGDSITEQWKKVPDIWEKYYGDFRPANFGIGGDQTQHVLWRIEHGELDGINPRVVVLMIGTNNSSIHTGAEIAEANREIVRRIQAKLPRSKILLLAIFPRDPRPERPNADHWERRIKAIREANAQLARLDNGKTIRFLDLGPAFLAPDGSIPDEIMPDQLHLTAAGYEIWAKTMQPLLEEMLAR